MANKILKLYGLVPEGQVTVYEAPEQTIAQHVKSKMADPTEIQQLLRDLLECLPEPQQRAFKISIRNEAMI